MAKAPKAKKAEASREAGALVFQNACRNRPLMFRVIGRSVRLAPLERCELDRSCLAAPELALLLQRREVRIIDAPAAGAGNEPDQPGSSDARPETERDDGETPGEHPDAGTAAEERPEDGKKDDA